jgi:succinyl-diaminopimelate desuccinylase
MSKAVDILIPLVQCPSITPDDAGAQVYLKSVLKERGFEIFDLPFEGRGGKYPVPNFFARRGTSSPHICFAGHTDVVPTGDESAWSVPPFSGEIVDGKIIGRGTADMKGQIAAFIAALPDENNGSISFLITGDEEGEAINGTERVLEWMKENDHIPDVCLVGEPSNPSFMGEEIKIGRRGSLSGTITISGTQGHVAYPEKAHNPIPYAVRLVSALTNHVFDQGSEHFPPSNLEMTSIDVGNSATNVIPAKVVAKFNIRYSDRFTRKELEHNVIEVLESVSKESGVTHDIIFGRGAERFLTQPGEWTDIISKAVEDVTGNKPAMTTGGGTSDARFVAPYCPVAEYGMINESIHKIDEHCKLADLEQCTAIYQQILKLYLQ